MEEIINKIYRNSQIDPKDLRPLLEKLKIEYCYDLGSFYETLSKELSKIVPLPESLENRQLNLVLAYLCTGKEEPETISILMKGLIRENESLKFDLMMKNSAIFDKKELIREVEELKLEINKMKIKNEEEINIKENLIRENQKLKKEILDHQYENGFFVDEEVFKNIEKENVQLHETNERIYKEIKEIWFKLVNDKIKSL